MTIAAVQPPLGQLGEHPPVALFDDSTVLRLFPTVMRRMNARECSLIRVGCKVATAVSTSHVGVTAARVLAKGETVGCAKAAIAG